MSELDDAVAEYIAARQEADACDTHEAWKQIEQAAWEKFFPIKVKHWNIDHPDDLYSIC